MRIETGHDSARNGSEIRAEGAQRVVEQRLTTILGVRLPDGRTFQVAGAEEDLELLLELLAQIP